MRFWKSISVASKLYVVIGTMAILIAAELFVVRFAMGTLSAVRAFVGGEGLWSKSQKNAAFRLQRYVSTQNEEDYQAFLDDLKVPEGDRQARLELSKPDPDLAIVRDGFLKGGIHPNDIDPMILLLRRFHWERHISRALAIWTEADLLLEEFNTAGEAYHQLLSSPSPDAEKIRHAQFQVLLLNDRLTLLEEQFSFVLGEGSRWLEGIIIGLLFVVVVTVEGVGLTLTFMTSRAITRGLSDIHGAAVRIGQGDFSKPVRVGTGDEIGRLAVEINKMGALLEDSYRTLEERVEKRTTELKAVSDENARLYQKASDAVKMRDEFMSIASHELRTPLTALSVQLQLLDRLASQSSEGIDLEKIRIVARGALQQSRRLSQLSDELMDLTRLRLGKLELRSEKSDLVGIVTDAVSELITDLTHAGTPITLEAPRPVMAVLDPLRISQVARNLISNAVKYGQGKPVIIRVFAEGEYAVIEVQDFGAGIPVDQRERIFERFQRVSEDLSIPGLGLGLYIARQIVAAHQGTIQVESEPGAGSVFRVRIPNLQTCVRTDRHEEKIDRSSLSVASAVFATPDDRLRLGEATELSVRDLGLSDHELHRGVGSGPGSVSSVES